MRGKSKKAKPHDLGASKKKRIVNVGPADKKIFEGARGSLLFGGRVGQVAGNDHYNAHAGKKHQNRNRAIGTERPSPLQHEWSA